MANGLFPLFASHDSVLMMNELSYNLKDLLSHTLISGNLSAFLLAYTAGILTSLSPCVYPMIPITVGIVTGNQAHANSNSRFSGLLLCFTYVFGMAMTYSTLGVSAAITGKLLGNLVENFWFQFFVANVMLFSGLWMLGLIRINNIPGLTQLMHAIHSSRKEGTYAGAFFMGIASGFIAAPCTTPALTVILTYISLRQSPSYGFILMFLFAIGMGSILLLIGLTADFSRKLLPKSGHWLIKLEKLGGWILILCSQYFFLKAGKYSSSIGGFW